MIGWTERANGWQCSKKRAGSAAPALQPLFESAFQTVATCTYRGPGSTCTDPADGRSQPRYPSGAAAAPAGSVFDEPVILTCPRSTFGGGRSSSADGSARRAERPRRPCGPPRVGVPRRSVRVRGARAAPPRRQASRRQPWTTQDAAAISPGKRCASLLNPLPTPGWTDFSRSGKSAAEFAQEPSQFARMAPGPSTRRGRPAPPTPRI